MKSKVEKIQAGRRKGNGQLLPVTKKRKNKGTRTRKKNLSFMRKVKEKRQKKRTTSPILRWKRGCVMKSISQEMHLVKLAARM